MAKDPEPSVDDSEELPPSFSEEFSAAFAAALSKAGFAKVRPGELPTGRDLLAGLGGVRGIIESLLPSIAFLVLFVVLDNLVVAAIAPVALGVLFILIRVIARQQVRSAVTGAVIAAVTAALTLITGRGENQSLFGIVINVVFFVAILGSLLARRPLIGLIVGLLTNDADAWRHDPAKRRVLTIATWLWAGLFGIRLAVELPLYFAHQVALLAAVKLVLGVPLYGALLWVTWLLVGTAFGSREVVEDDTAEV